jgi:hypothetical protein
MWWETGDMGAPAGRCPAGLCTHLLSSCQPHPWELSSLRVLGHAPETRGPAGSCAPQRRAHSHMCTPKSSTRKADTPEEPHAPPPRKVYTKQGRRPAFQTIPF